MFMITKVDGLFRRITERRALAGGSSVDVIVGFRERRSGSAKSPGPGWRQVPGEKRSWMKREPRIEERFVDNSEVIETSEWPTGIKKYGFLPDQYECIVLPSINAGVDAAGAMGKRKAPEINLETVEMTIKEAGLAMPTAAEFEEMVEALWTREHKPVKRAPMSGSAVVTGRRPKVIVDKKTTEAEAEAARLAEEAETARLAEEAETARLAEEAASSEDENSVKA